MSTVSTSSQQIHIFISIGDQFLDGKYANMTPTYLLTVTRVFNMLIKDRSLVDG